MLLPRPRKSIPASGRWLRAILLLLSCALVFNGNLRAQELNTQPTPFTVWLDFQKLSDPNAKRPPFPIWLESVQTQQKKQYDGSIKRTTYRLRFRKLGGLNADMMLRVFFDDQAGAQPVVSAWSELGEKQFSSNALGTGVGLPTSEALSVAMKGVDYIDIDVPGDGEGVKGAFLTSLETSQVKHAVDFTEPEPVADPFDNEPAVQLGEDAFLFGRVKATLAVDPVKLTPNTAPGVTFEFDLDAQPQLAVLTFEILNVDITAPPTLTANDHALGAVSPMLPDLADPAYSGMARAFDADVRVNYTGWLKCQKAIPTSALHAGTNKLTIQLDNRSGPVAIRAVEVQLKEP